MRYPFPLQPPQIPQEGNHVGSYQTTFELPDEWRGRRVLLEFDGIGPAATVWLNTWLGIGVGVGLGLGIALALPEADRPLAGDLRLVQLLLRVRVRVRVRVRLTSP